MLFFVTALISVPAWAVRVKDVAALRGARDNELIGFGIVVGLDGKRKLVVCKSLAL